MAEHILVVPRSRGKTYIIGDVHGAYDVLTEVLSRLNTNDTLIIVGDLTDRGAVWDEDLSVYKPTSKEVLDLVLHHVNAPEGILPKIYVIQGNHEQDFLRLLSLLEQVTENSSPDFINKVVAVELLNYIKNGGSWIFNRPDNTLAQKARFDAFQNFAMNKDFSADATRKMIPHLRSVVLSPNVMRELLPEIPSYRNFIAELPFVIKLEGEDPVLIVHSDLELSDEEIDRRIQTKQAFTEQEIKHLTLTRVKEFRPAGVRDQHSRLVVGGHNILHEPNTSELHPAIPVRRDTNHLNLDGGAYFTQGFLCYNVDENTVEVIGSKIREGNRVLFDYWKNEINAHLRIKAHAKGRDSVESEYESKRSRSGLF